MIEKKLVAVLATAVLLAGSANAGDSKAVAPGSKFDLSQWKITLPMDDNGDKKPDEVDVAEIKKYAHPDYFYLDTKGGMVFVAPNKAITTANSSNTRSELRQMLRGTNTKLKTHGPENNFAVAARKGADKYGMIGGKMEATLKVDHVALNAGNPDSRAAYSVVVGQIHASDYEDTSSGFGYGNEPIKIFYKKWPGHKTGSVFWNYERNLAKDNPDRKDISYPVWGKDWRNSEDPGDLGIALGEEFSYTINVHGNIMYVTFESPRLGKKEFIKSLISNLNAAGQPDLKDNPLSYGGDSLYFKAGAYNQCSTKSDKSFWAAACAGTSDWAKDKANGDYTQVTFSRLVVGQSTPIE